MLTNEQKKHLDDASESERLIDVRLDLLAANTHIDALINLFEQVYMKATYIKVPGGCEFPGYIVQCLVEQKIHNYDETVRLEALIKEMEAKECQTTNADATTAHTAG